MPELFSHVLNVISADADALAGPVRAAVASLGAAGDIAWLSPERAFDIPFLGTPDNVCAAARETAKGLKADINAVSSAHRRKQLLIADMDSTIITAECLDELADMVGLKAEISAITERAMRGELQFEPALARTREPSEGPAPRRARTGHGRAHPPDGRRKSTGAHHAGERRPYAARLRRLHLLHPARRRAGRLRRRSRPMCCSTTASI